MAGLPVWSARVIVGPPLSATRPSFGSVADRSPAWAKPQVPSLSRFEPSEVSGPAPPQSPCELPETMLPSTESDPDSPTGARQMPPVPPVGAEFEAIVMAPKLDGP